VYTSRRRWRPIEGLSGAAAPTTQVMSLQMVTGELAREGAGLAGSRGVGGCRLCGLLRNEKQNGPAPRNAEKPSGPSGPAARGVDLDVQDLVLTRLKEEARPLSEGAGGARKPSETF